MKIISINNVEQFAKSLAPKTRTDKTVQKILDEISQKGDAALKKYVKKFDGYAGPLRVSEKEFNQAMSKVSSQQIQAIKQSSLRLAKTETKTKKLLHNFTINLEGTKISKKFVPINSVGCYIPGGKARYPSSVIMSVVPARIAGVKRIIAVSPPNGEGRIDHLTLAAAKICGVDEFYKIGGVQAIGALAFGTKSIRAVDKIVGPGSYYVTVAKSLVSTIVSIDMQAGPTELGIIADDSANAEFVATDIISQAEHSPDSFCYVITTSQKLAKKIQAKISQKIKSIKRKDIVQASLKKNGFIGVCKSQTDAIRLVNCLAPEHLEVLTKNSSKTATAIENAGLVLVGPYSPSSASDYLLGSNHILPTNRFAKSRGSLSVMDFVKLKTEITSTKKSLKQISKQLEIFTKAEDLPNHYLAVRSRL